MKEITMKLQSGHEAQKLSKEEADDQMRNCTGFTHGLIRIYPDRWLFPVNFVKYANNLYNFEFESSDVLVMTWPKCGTTWAQEIIWTMRNSPDLDHPLRGMPINTRVPFLDCDMYLRSSNLLPPDPETSTLQEFVGLCPSNDPADGFYLQLTKALPKPRTIKTHLPISLFSPTLLDKAKYLFLLLMVYGPYWLHLKEAWEMRNHPNMHFIFYEDLKTNIKSELQKLNDFLNTRLTEEQLNGVKDYTHFSEMKQRDNVFQAPDKNEVLMNTDYCQQHGGFFRKGEIGSWKSKMSQNQNQKLDDWIEKHLSPLGITFKQVV